MLNICSHAEFNGQVYELTDKLRSKAKRISDDMNRNGMRVLAIAQKALSARHGTLPSLTRTDGTYWLPGVS